VTNSLFLVQRILRGLGYESEIFVEHRDSRLSDVLFLVDDLPDHSDYVLIVHHSMGHGALDFILSLDARKILMYHNVTPPHFFAGISERHQHLCETGRSQINAIVAARPDLYLAASAFNIDHAYGTYETAVDYVEQLQDAGVDEVMCIMQMGTVPHEVCIETLRQWGEHVIPRFRGDA